MKRIVFTAVIIFCRICAGGQTRTTAGELDGMLQHAQADAARGDLNAAMTTYRQAMLLAPDSLAPMTGLAAVLIKDGQYKEAALIIGSVGEERYDPGIYQLLTSAKAGQGNRKGAEKTAKEGIARFPRSGVLYSDLGRIYVQEGKTEKALEAWQQGIDHVPGHAENYYLYAAASLLQDRPLWGLLYGELYLYLAHDTAHDEALKAKLFAGYKKLFDGVAVPQKGLPGFEQAVMQLYTQLTPVVSDGITTENLTMVRARFLMEWFARYDKQYPFPLFRYQDELLRNGRFDIACQWLYGKAESENAFTAWNTFHEGDISRFLLWLQQHRPMPAATPGYYSGT